ncbi:unnamed protein product [Urochloa decumbens]|uniref:DCD domain-containing protein n=1 Tax=Urochloa decumbens TaxID=240449 RepID=A0ABC8V7R7_9POAL
MVRKLRRKGDASAAATPKGDASAAATPKVDASAAVTPKADGPGSAKRAGFKKKKKAAAAESAGTAGASASAPTPAPKPVEASPAAADNGEASQSKREDRKGSGKESMNKGEEEKGKGEDRKASRREMANGRDEDRVRREEKRRRTAGKEEEGGDERGYIFMCNTRTKPECYRSGVFGLPRGKMDVVEKIRPGAKLFLYDFDLKLLYGVYKADTRGGLDLVRHAFEGKFPAQVKFSVDIDCLPVPESSFKHAIKENYNSKGRFTQELSPTQVHRLLAIFKPIGLSQSTQHIEETRRPRIVEDRREPYDYEERRLPQYVIERGTPIHAHAYPLEDHYKITHSLHPPLLEEPRHILAPDPYHMQEPQHVPPKYYHQVATSSLNHQPHMDILHERTAAEPTVVREPLLARDYGALPGELAARSERVDELYRSYKLSTRAMDLQPGPSYVAASYENPRSLYGEILQRPVVTRVRGPSVPVSTRYSFDALPPYR